VPCSLAVRTALDPGMARCGGPSPLGAMGSTCRVVRGRRGRLPASGLTGRDGAGLAVGGSDKGRRQTGDRRIARPQAGAPPRRLAGKGAGPAPGCWSVGWGAPERAGAHQSPAGASWAGAGVVPDHGLDREVVTTLCGRWAGDGPVSSVPERPMGLGGEQTAAAARPRHVRSAVGQALTAR
jgi:hypothetical protein